MGDFSKPEYSLNHSCVARCDRLDPPLVLRENLLSGLDNGRDRRFKAQSALRSRGKESGNLGKFPNELWAKF